MLKSSRFSRVLYLIALAVFVIGLALLLTGLLQGGTHTTTNALGGHVNVPNDPALPLVIPGLILTILAAVPILVFWGMALVRLARLQKWLWFACMLIFSLLALIFYLFSDVSSPTPSST